LQIVRIAGEDQAEHAHRRDARGREGEDDEVVRGRHQRADERRVGRDVDRVVGVVALLLHQRDHHRAHRRDVGERRAGDAAEQRAADHVAHAQAAADVADQAVGEADDPLRDAAVEHQLAGEDEERDRQEGEDLHPADHLLEHDGDRQAGGEDGRDRRQADRERDRHAEHEQDDEADREDGQFHGDGPCAARAPSTRPARLPRRAAARSRARSRRGRSARRR
jgi:hypothetical protein